MNQELYTPAEVAIRLKVNRDCIYDWVKSGKLPAHRPLPRVIRISEENLNTFLQGASDDAKPALNTANESE